MADLTNFIKDELLCHGADILDREGDIFYAAPTAIFIRRTGAAIGRGSTAESPCKTSPLPHNRWA